MDLTERFWSQVKFTDTCWLWTGSAGGKGGAYGEFRFCGLRVQAHRWAYEFCVGPIPEGLQIDHLCRVRLCVNSDHLEPVSLRVNVLRGNGLPARNARKTHCSKGHEFNETNTSPVPTGGRRCRTCNREYTRKWRERKTKEARGSAGHYSLPSLSHSF